MHVRLVPVHEGEATYELTEDLTLVGRSEGCDIRLENRSVSKLHCVLVKTDGAVLLRDLGSTNGTRVNGQRVRRAALLPNDVIAIAGLQFRILYGKAADLEDSKTEAIADDELADLVKSVAGPGRSGESSIEPIRTNQLPDVYEEEPSDEENEG